MAKWQIQEAKAHLSRVVREAVSAGPQYITHRGKPIAVLISQEEFEHLTKSKLSFVEFMRRSPLRGIKLRIQRDRSMPRDIDEL